jgi:hypothetical protein
VTVEIVEVKDGEMLGLGRESAFTAEDAESAEKK